MSVELMQIYNHFRHADQADLKDENLASVAEYAAWFIGADAVLTSLNVDKTESAFYDDDEDIEDQPRKKHRSEIPYTLDDDTDLEEGQPLLFNWVARSSNAEETLMGDGESGLDVTTVRVDAEVNYKGTLLRVHIEFTENVFGPVTTLVIEGTDGEGFLEQWASDTWQPQLENIALDEPVIVCSSTASSFCHGNICFSLKAGVSMILKAIPGDNLKKIIKGPEPLYMYGLLLDGDFNWVPMYLKSFPFFQVELGATIRLQGCFFDISTKTPEQPSSEEEEDEAETKVHGEPAPFAQLNLGGQVWADNNYVPLWAEVPADNEVIAFRLAGTQYRLPWTLGELKPLFAGNSATQDAFASVINNVEDWKYHITSMEYFYDLYTQTLYSLSIQLALLNTGASVSPGGVRVDLEQMELHCNVGAPDTKHAASLWAEGVGSIAGLKMPVSITWGTEVALTADGDGVPPENLLATLDIKMPEPDPEMIGIADYRIEFLPPDWKPRLSMQPLYQAKDMSAEGDEDDDTPDGPIVLNQAGVVSWPRPLARRRRPVPRKPNQ
ncbi:hypothetical protein [Pseudomonas sp. Marseille-P9899]|uniref:hypothetical protein n=1 Tax=Pseudomonas sp. Marseille-P9899 TaxID=2730401 RepID=UPI00158C6D18|nr:hypothetical protein [Pseudomonas sp. Marseille-P9899]